MDRTLLVRNGIVYTNLLGSARCCPQLFLYLWGRPVGQLFKAGSRAEYREVFYLCYGMYPFTETHAGDQLGAATGVVALYLE